MKINGNDNSCINFKQLRIKRINNIDSILLLPQIDRNNAVFKKYDILLKSSMAKFKIQDSSSKISSRAIKITVSNISKGFDLFKKKTTDYFCTEFSEVIEDKRNLMNVILDTVKKFEEKKYD